jgi:hypothetical protein
MSNRRERRKILKNMGLLGLAKKNPFKGESNIEEGENRRRQHLQSIKNREILENQEKEQNDIFVYRGDSNEYGNFKTMLVSRNWDSIGSDNDG